MKNITKESWTIVVKVKYSSNHEPMNFEIFKFTKYEDYQKFENQFNLFHKAKYIYEQRLQELITNQEFSEEFVENYMDETFPWLDNFCNLDLMLLKDFILDIYEKVASYDFFDFKTVHEVQTYNRETIEMKYNK